MIMKVFNFLQYLIEHSFMYNDNTYVFVSVPKIAKDLYMHEHTIRGYVNSFLYNKFLLKMNYKDYNYAYQLPHKCNLYKFNLNLRNIDDVPDEELHSANK